MFGKEARGFFRARFWSPNNWLRISTYCRMWSTKFRFWSCFLVFQLNIERTTFYFLFQVVQEIPFELTIYLWEWKEESSLGFVSKLISLSLLPLTLTLVRKMTLFRFSNHSFARNFLVFVSVVAELAIRLSLVLNGSWKLKRTRTLWSTVGRTKVIMSHTKQWRMLLMLTYL